MGNQQKKRKMVNFNQANPTFKPLAIDKLPITSYHSLFTESKPVLPA
jgi:hypothetical protein